MWGASPDLPKPRPWRPTPGTFQAAILNSIVRTVAEGGGSAIGATRHVYIAEGDPGCPPQWSENEMLEFTNCERRPNGRLSRQFVAPPGTGGLVMHLMETRV